MVNVSIDELEVAWETQTDQQLVRNLNIQLNFSLVNIEHHHFVATLLQGPDWALLSAADEAQ